MTNGLGHYSQPTTTFGVCGTCQGGWVALRQSEVENTIEPQIKLKGVTCVLKGLLVQRTLVDLHQHTAVV